MTIYGAANATDRLYDDTAHAYDAVLVLSFGGPDQPEDVIPFLQNVSAGRIPVERLQEVAEHYYHFGGKSPINEQNLMLIDALRAELAAHGPNLPVYFGNRNWHPLVGDTVRQMRDDGVKRAIIFITSAFSSYSGCRQYREDMQRAVSGVEDAPLFDKLRVYYNHPGFIEPMIENVRAAYAQIPAERHATTRLIFTTHSVPLTMAQHSDYVPQFEEASKLVARGAGIESYTLAYQSRSGAPHIPWLEPDISEVLDAVKAEGASDVVIVPIGFISDHMEVLFDLDTEARDHCAAIGLGCVRAATVGVHPAFISMIRELIMERMTENPTRRFMGERGANHDICPVDCCLK